MSVFTPQEFSDWNGGTGFYRPSAVQNAIQMGENKAVEWLNTGLAPTAFVDEIPWPSDWNNRKIMLAKVRLITIDKVTSLRDDGSCGWLSGSECGTIFNQRQSIVRLTDPYRRWCLNGICPERMQIEYTAGFSAADIVAGTPIGTQLRAIVFTAALGFLQIAIGLNADGNVFKPNYTAAGYSESRQLPERAGSEEIINEFVQLGKSLARDLQIKRAPRIQ